MQLVFIVLESVSKCCVLKVAFISNHIVSKFEVRTSIVSTSRVVCFFFLQFLTPLIIVKYVSFAVVHNGESDSAHLRFESTFLQRLAK